MFASFKDFFLTVFASSYTVNFASFLSALTTFCAALYGFFSFNQWMKQKSIEKQSDYAEQSLNFLDTSHEALIELLCKPSIDQWDQKFAVAKAEFGQARRKAHRIDDKEIDAYYQQYDKLIKSIEEKHYTCVTEGTSFRLKSEADNSLSHIIEELKAIYNKLFPALIEKSLIKIAQ